MPGKSPNQALTDKICSPMSVPEAPSQSWRYCGFFPFRLRLRITINEPAKAKAALWSADQPQHKQGQDDGLGINVGANEGSRGRGVGVELLPGSNICGVHRTELSDFITTLMGERHFVVVQIETDVPTRRVICHRLFTARIGSLLKGYLLDCFHRAESCGTAARLEPLQWRH